MRNGRELIIRIAAIGFVCTILAFRSASEPDSDRSAHAWDDPAAVRAGTQGSTDFQDNFLAYGYDKEPYVLDDGPHLFIDWRYIQPGRTDYFFPDGTEAPRYDGDPQQLPTIMGRPRQAPFNIRIEVQPAEKIGPVLKNDQPWEYGFGYHTLLHWEGKYRLWYEIVPPRETKLGQLLCYAESEDGLTWTKPAMKIFEFGGSKDNNVVYGEPLCGHSFHGHSVFIDPPAPPEERFKLIYMSGCDEQELAVFKAAHPESVSPSGEAKKLPIRLAHSADGVHWTSRPGFLMVHMSDTQTTVYYDDVLKRYVGFLRLAHMGRRCIGRTESPDLTTMPIPEVALFPSALHDRPGDDYYISGYSRYPGTTTMHLMLASIYNRHTDSAQIALASSMEGKHWDWLPGHPVAETGQDGAWDGGCIFGGIGLTQLPGDRVASPFVGYTLPHKFPRYERHMGAIGLLTWPSERLSALVAEEEGEIFTIPLAAHGDKLFLNFQTRRNGYVKVAVRDSDGRSLEDCDSLFGDSLKRQVTWKGEGTIGVKPGEEFELQIQLRAAKLYSFELR